MEAAVKFQFTTVEAAELELLCEFERQCDVLMDDDEVADSLAYTQQIEHALAEACAGGSDCAPSFH